MPEILYLQPVPRNNWGDNLAHILPRSVWDVVRKEVYARANHTCELCGQTMLTLNAHEDWKYNDKLHVQHLASIVCLCELCHQCIHWFRTEHLIIDGKLEPSFIDTMKDHIKKVNGWLDKDLIRAVKRMSYMRDVRNNHDYKLEYGIFTPARIIEEFVRVKGARK